MPTEERKKKLKEYHITFVQKVLDQGMTVREKYIDTFRKNDRNWKYRNNAILSIKRLFGNKHLI